MAEITVFVDNIEVRGQAGETLLELARRAGADIPTLCQSDLTSAYGSCGICVVEEEGKPKLLRSCSTAAMDGMRILTRTERVIKTRQTVLELLLSDHTGDCRPPCALACPAETDCQGYVGLIANGEYKEAAALIREKLPLPSSLGRVCPHPCEEACRRELVEEPISIAHLKYFAADKYLEAENMPAPGADTGKSVGVIGGGPGGLSAAYFLRQQGHAVTVYEQMPEMGGMFRYGIPEYRLPRNILAREAELIHGMGVVYKNNIKIGKDIQFEQIRKDHDAVVLSIGAWKSTRLGVPGEELAGVLGGIDFLRESAMHKAGSLEGKAVAVVGGGNTAMDACRTAVRLGAETVYNIYRRTKAEMPAEAIEIEEAWEESVVFKNLTNPIDITQNSDKLAVRLQKMELGEPDRSGRRAPVPIPGDEETVLVDYVIAAIGQSVVPDGFEGLSLTKRNTISADEKTYRTSLPGVFAIGDAINKGPDIGVAAMGAGRKASLAVDAFLNGLEWEWKERELVKQELTASDFTDREKICRAKMPHRPASERKHDFKEINNGYDEETARKEASRCLECGCMDYFECRLINYTQEYEASVNKYIGEKHHRKIEPEHPYILRNPDKCILCGLCVRVCSEAVGVSAFGLKGRGFEAQAVPSLELPLKDTECVNCGQCVASCPTGALMENICAYKAVPVVETRTHTVCPGCSVGCKVVVSSKGGMLLRVLPDFERDPKTMLCETGRFGFTSKANDVVTPLADGKSVSTESAIKAAKKAVSEFVKANGGSALGVSVSPSLTNEEMEAVVDYAKSLGASVFMMKDQNDGCERPREMYPDLDIEPYFNNAGLKRLGIPKKPADTVKAAAAFGGSPAPDPELPIIFAAAASYSAAGSPAPVFIPTAGPFEVNGSVTDKDGYVVTVLPARLGSTDVTRLVDLLR